MRFWMCKVEGCEREVIPRGVGGADDVFCSKTCRAAHRAAVCAAYKTRQPTPNIKRRESAKGAVIDHETTREL